MLPFPYQDGDRIKGEREGCGQQYHENDQVKGQNKSVVPVYHSVESAHDSF
ncbi:hypothetical protein GJJ30_10095 [Larkinella terrae]|uniref:Uncharacterized protein n=1 Tax=Larkinella terrae TaxID=2025311 RepID=A0A7K0EJM7_9BACT|nr:hypothetical protein [Larkinella terrae]